MYLRNRIICFAGTAVLLANAVAAQELTTEAPAGQAVEFVDVKDAVPGRFFDATTTAADPANPNRLIIRFNTGRDPATWKANDFRASTAAFSHVSAMDTITFKIVSPSGYYVSTVTYKQQGTGSVVRTGRAAGASNWVVGHYASDLGTYGANPDVSETIDVSGQYWTALSVSITTGVHAFSTPQLGSATLSITSAEVIVALQARPAAVVETPLAVRVDK